MGPSEGLIVTERSTGMPPPPAATHAPMVSVILPTYDRLELVPRAIRSVLAQSYGDFELIVVDDASPVDPAPAVASFGDPRIRLIRHETNRGNAAARNTAIRAARGRYVAFLDDDDEWAPDKLALQIPVLESSEPEVALVYCARRLLRGGEVVGVDAPGKEGDVLDELLPWGLMACPSVVLKGEVLDEVGLFDERLRRGVDDDLWRRIARRYQVRYVDRVLVDCHTGHGAQVSRVETMDEVREDIFRWNDKLAKFRAEFEARPAKHAIVLRRLGERRIQLGELAAGRRLLLRSIRVRPLNPEGYGLLVASLLGRRGLAVYLGAKEALMGRVRRVLGHRAGWRRNRYTARR